MSTPATVMKTESVRRSSGFQWKPILLLVQQRPSGTNATELLHEQIRKFKESRLHHARNRVPHSGESFVLSQSPRDLLMSGRPDALQVFAESLRTRKRSQSLTPASSIPPTASPMLRARRSISGESSIGRHSPEPLSSAPGALLISAWIVGGVVFGIVVLFLMRLRQRRRKSSVPNPSLSERLSAEICIERL